jgi:hypothetical protein
LTVSSQAVGFSRISRPQVDRTKIHRSRFRSVRKWTGYLLLLVLPGTLLLLPLAAWWLHRRGGARGRTVISSPQNDVIEGRSRDWRADKAAAPHVPPTRRKPHIGSARFQLRSRLIQGVAATPDRAIPVPSPRCYSQSQVSARRHREWSLKGNIASLRICGAVRSAAIDGALPAR